MNRKQLFVLIGLALVIGLTGIAVYKRGAASWQSSGGEVGGKVLGDFALNDVATVAITTGSAGVVIEKKNGMWSVKERDGYPASFDRTSQLIRALWKLKPVQGVKAGPSQLGRLRLVAPGKDAAGSGTLIDLQGQDGKRICALLVGKEFVRQAGNEMMGGFPVGRYVMPVKDSAPVLLVSETFSQAEPDPVQWLDRDFVRIDKVKTLGVSGTAAAVKWKVSRESEATTDWKLEGAKPDEKVDSAKVPSASMIGSMFADVIAANTDPKSVGLDKPAMLTVETFDGFTYVLKLGRETAGNYPVAVQVSAQLPAPPAADAKVDDKQRKEAESRRKELEEKLAKEKKLEARIYLVARSSLDSLFKERAQLLADKPTPTPSPSPSPKPAAAPVPAPTPVPAASPTPGVTVTTPPISVSEPAPAPAPVASPTSGVSVTTPPISLPEPTPTPGPGSSPTPVPSPSPARTPVEAVTESIQAPTAPPAPSVSPAP